MKKMTINENKKTDERIKSPKYSQNKWRQEDEILDIWNYDIKVNEYRQVIKLYWRLALWACPNYTTHVDPVYSSASAGVTWCIQPISCTRSETSNQNDTKSLPIGQVLI